MYRPGDVIKTDGPPRPLVDLRAKTPPPCTDAAAHEPDRISLQRDAYVEALMHCGCPNRRVAYTRARQQYPRTVTRPRIVRIPGGETGNYLEWKIEYDRLWYRAGRLEDWHPSEPLELSLARHKAFADLFAQPTITENV